MVCNPPDSIEYTEMLREPEHLPVILEADTWRATANAGVVFSF